ncbi:MAG: PASTA domain-containing protein [Bacteroidales bacterium]|nr:PASTA domain-containing protein [Bacteroidales bacterium]
MARMNWIIKNLLGIVAYILGLALVITIFLSVVTHHGQQMEVPDFTGMSVSQAQQLAEASGFRVDVYDSVYVRRMEKGAIFSQNPKAGAKVKKGRRVSVTINAVVPKKLSMPNLVGYSMRQAKAELGSRGLKLGRLIYVRDMATNNVLKQLLGGVEIAPGTQVESESSIDLVVGLNDIDNRTMVPDVTGLRYSRAVDAVHDNSLNVYRAIFDRSVRSYADSLNAVVYRQKPEAGGASVPMGTEMSLYLTNDPDKVPTK